MFVLTMAAYNLMRMRTPGQLPSAGRAMTQTVVDGLKPTANR
jgi:hypothetical protein